MQGSLIHLMVSLFSEKDYFASLGWRYGRVDYSPLCALEALPANTSFPCVYLLPISSLQTRRAMAQAISRQPLTAEARVLGSVHVGFVVDKVTLG
jgi:hypothetical protein